MDATAWFYVAFAAVVVMIVATVWGAMVLRPARSRRDAGGTATPGDEPGETHVPERRAA